MAKKKSNAGKFVLGALVGAALGLLFAPKSGKETRRIIKEKKAKDLKKHAEDLVAYTKDKATPVVEKAAEELREKAVDVTKTVLEKLESKEK